MEAGKIEFAPDYKSKSQVRRIAMQKGQPPDSSPEDIAAPDQLNANEAVAAERARLERKVIEAAKVFTSEDVTDKWDKLVSFRILCGAVSALESFEAEQNK